MKSIPVSRLQCGCMVVDKTQRYVVVWIRMLIIKGDHQLGYGVKQKKKEKKTTSSRRADAMPMWLPSIIERCVWDGNSVENIVGYQMANQHSLNGGFHAKTNNNYSTRNDWCRTVHEIM